MKLRSILLLALILGVVALSACGPSTPAATATPEGPLGDPALGQTKYTGTCVSCHGPDAKGMTGLGKDLTTSEFLKGKTNAEMVAFLQSGRPASDPLNTTGVDMPPKGGNPALNDQDLADIIAYLRSLQN
jgi:mono/diheme cytochrome c family protein